jgi:Matrixin
MLGTRSLSRAPIHSSSPRRLQPVTESLEPKLLLYSTLGGDWTYGSRISYSFVPDGTSVGGTPSALYQSMSERGFSENQWKSQFRRAAAVWEAVANINLAEVGDGGQAIGVSGNQQNDSRFGDIRFAAVAQPGTTLAHANLPPDFNGGTRAGDIVMNSGITWNINSTYDLQTVAIHEIGHALGLDHSTLTNAVMYEFYNGAKQNLSSDDVAGIRS